jgi:excinuclease UvrABC nuclease subunit
MRVDVSRLPSLLFTERSRLPRCSGIYFAVSSTNEVLYIGRSSCIRQRWRKHDHRHSFRELRGVRVAWLEAHRDCLYALERDLIALLRPRLNGVGAVTEHHRLRGLIQSDERLQGVCVVAAYQS